MISPLAEAALTVGFGALAGGVTNAVAIWMLFHPRDPVRLFGRRIGWLHGAIPKNQARLARAMGRTVATQLLTATDLERMLTQPDFRAAFHERLRAALDTVLDQPRPSLRELLPAPLAGEAEKLLLAAAGEAATRLDDYLAGEEFRDSARGVASTIAERIRDRPIEELLTPERERALGERVERWIAETVAGPGFETALRESIDRIAERVLRDDRTFQDVLPAGLVAAAERGIAAYLPLVLERLGRLLDEPDARRRLEQALHGILDRFMSDLRFHQRIVAAVLITPETVDRVLRVIEDEGAERLSELLREEEVREAMARGVNDAIVEFLGRPVTSVLGAHDEPAVIEAKHAVAEAALRVARHEATREFLIAKLRDALGAAERRTWGDLLGALPPERIADAIVAAARDPRARDVYARALERAARAVMDRPIGRPGALLPDDAADRIENAVAAPIWDWTTAQVPLVAARIDIASRVEEKVLEFPPERLEELVRGVTERELVLIIHLGYVLGAIVGLALVALRSVLN